MHRLGIAGRLALLVAAALFLMQVVAIAVQVSRDEGFTLSGIRPSFAREIAGIVTLFDTLPAADRPVALRAVDAGRLAAEITSRPRARDADAGWWLRLVTRQIEQRLGTEGIAPERVSVDYVADDGNNPRRRGPLARLLGRHLQLTVALADGSYLVLDPDSEADAYLFGSALGYFAAVLGFVVLGITLIVIFRETRPLRSLVSALERFGRNADPVPLAEHGAPELRALIRTTNAMQRQIAGLVRNRALMLAGLAHDLRTQLTRLRLRLELLPESDARARAIADADAMHELVEEALAFAGDKPGEPGPDDIVAAIGRLVQERSGDPVNWSGFERPVHVALGPTELRRVLDNLVDNAIAYGREATISLATTSRTARLTIADRGPGIPAAERERVFEPFYRSEVSRNRAYGGTGLGLAIVKQILDRHGATATIGDRPGGGCLVTIDLPLAGRPGS